MLCGYYLRSLRIGGEITPFRRGDNSVTQGPIPMRARPIPGTKMADDGRRLPEKLRGLFKSNETMRRSSQIISLNKKRSKSADHTISSIREPPAIPASGACGDHSYSAPVEPPAPVQFDPYLGAGATLPEFTHDQTWSTGRRVVELDFLASQMSCQICNAWLRLSDIVEEKICGLGSILHIKCQACSCVRAVSTGKRNEKGAFHINTKATAGKQKKKKNVCFLSPDRP